MSSPPSSRPPAPRTLRLRAPAKLNLGLRVIGRRDDGYHLLESVFAPIELWDELEIELLEPGAGPAEIELSVEVAGDAGLPKPLAEVSAGPDNLVHRAAQAFCQATGLARRVRIRLVKAIPAGAGLGGGSSDAAAALRGLASLTARAGDAARDVELASLALPLGADVPFFLSPRPALVSGIGEIIEPLEGLPETDLVVANPGISLATAEVYRAADALGSALTQPRPGSTMRAISRLCLSQEEEDLKDALGELLVNDLEPAARRLCPPVGRLADKLREAGAIGVCMTGSGATVFGVFVSREHADRAAEMLRGSQAQREAGSKGGNAGGWVEVTRLIGHSRTG